MKSLNFAVAVSAGCSLLIGCGSDDPVQEVEAIQLDADPAVQAAADGPRVPDQFLGVWDMAGGDCRRDGSAIVIEARAIVFSGEPAEVTDVRHLAADSIELRIVGTQSGEEEPLGFTLGEGGRSLSMAGPGFSMPPLRRCLAISALPGTDRPA
ncbi:MAG: hypothetical protein ACTS1X_08535 [Parasphingopyxis sp.]|uniref:hypothetical protein n=1 Tax=Parasphingopyxis sp. TaxID=1920299 RepID=UPI003FA0EEF1